MGLRARMGPSAAGGTIVPDVTCGLPDIECDASDPRRPVPGLAWQGGPFRDASFEPCRAVARDCAEPWRALTSITTLRISQAKARMHFPAMRARLVPRRHEAWRG